MNRIHGLRGTACWPTPGPLRHARRRPPPLSQPGRGSRSGITTVGDLTKNELRRALVQDLRPHGRRGQDRRHGRDARRRWGVFDTDGSGAIDRAEFSQPGGLGETLAASLRDFTPPPSRPGAFAASASSMAASPTRRRPPGPRTSTCPRSRRRRRRATGSYAVDGTPVVQATIVQAASRWCKRHYPAGGPADASAAAVGGARHPRRAAVLRQPPDANDPVASPLMWTTKLVSVRIASVLHAASCGGLLELLGLALELATLLAGEGDSAGTHSSKQQSNSQTTITCSRRERYG